jgi:SAM-dependent methyltransferase
MERIYGEKISIDQSSIKDFYAKRAKGKVKIDIDAPVVLCGDKDKNKIEEWTCFEVKNRLPLLQLDKNSIVLELGCGTGRISKFITQVVDKYVGVDYVKEFIDIIEKREDIDKKENTYFLNNSFQGLVKESSNLPIKDKFNRLIISGGVFMYINDTELKECVNNLIELLDESCIIYISEPIAIRERLTLNKFYSSNLESEYSAIYRTIDEYQQIFSVFYKQGFKLKIDEEFFYNDIKLQKETKQWIFVLER